MLEEGKLYLTDLERYYLIFYLKYNAVSKNTKHKMPLFVYKKTHLYIKTGILILYI